MIIAATALVALLNALYPACRPSQIRAAEVTHAFKGGFRKAALNAVELRREGDCTESAAILTRLPFSTLTRYDGRLIETADAEEIRDAEDVVNGKYRTAIRVYTNGGFESVLAPFQEPRAIASGERGQFADAAGFLIDEVRDQVALETKEPYIGAGEIDYQPFVLAIAECGAGNSQLAGQLLYYTLEESANVFGPLQGPDEMPAMSLPSGFIIAKLSIGAAHSFVCRPSTR